MKRMNVWLSVFLLGCMAVFTGCSDDSEETAPALEVETIMASGTSLETGEAVSVDLNGATAAEDVPLDAVVEVGFSRGVDVATATNANFSLVTGSETVALDANTSGSVVTLTPQSELNTGTEYTLTVSDNLRAADGGSFSSLSRTFKTAGRGEVTPPQAESQVAYWKLDGDAQATVGEAETVVEQVEYDTDRFGFMNSAASFNGASSPGTGDILEFSSPEGFVFPSMTTSVWFKVNPEDYAGSRFMYGVAVERGYFMELGTDAVSWMKNATSHRIDPDPANHEYGIAWTDPNGSGDTGGPVLYNYSGSISELVADGEWHQLTITFDASTSYKTIFVDGNKIMQVDLDAETNEWFLKEMAIDERGVEAMIDTNLALGYAGSTQNQATGWAVYENAENTFKGMMDDFRIFNVALSESEVQNLYNAEKP